MDDRIMFFGILFVLLIGSYGFIQLTSTDYPNSVNQENIVISFPETPSEYEIITESTANTEQQKLQFRVDENRRIISTRESNEPIFYRYNPEKNSSQLSYAHSSMYEHEGNLDWFIIEESIENEFRNGVQKKGISLNSSSLTWLTFIFDDLYESSVSDIQITNSNIELEWDENEGKIIELQIDFIIMFEDDTTVSGEINMLEQTEDSEDDSLPESDPEYGEK